MSPGVGAVKRHVNRDISDDLDSLFIGIRLQLLPLNRKKILLEAVKIDFRFQLLRFLLEHFRIPVLQILGPLAPADILLLFFDRHVQAVILQPETVFFYKVSVILSRHKAPEGFFQYLKTAFINFFIIYIFRIVSEITCIAFFLFQKTFFHQRLQINKIRISRVSGKGLVRGIPVTGRSQGKNLPVFLACFFQIVYKSVSFFGKTPDPVS